MSESERKQEEAAEAAEAEEHAHQAVEHAAVHVYTLYLHCIHTCVCIYVCTYTYVLHTYIQCTHSIYLYAYIHAYIHTYRHACMHTYIHMHTCIHTYRHACMHTYIHPSIHPCINTYIHACIRTCMQTKASSAADASESGAEAQGNDLQPIQNPPTHLVWHPGDTRHIGLNV